MLDVLIRHAQIVDGTGAPAFNGDIGLTGDRIVAIQSQLTAEARHIFDAKGQVVAPGFVDAHTHDDLAILRWSTVPPKVRQGITTLVIGNCGFGLAPMVPEHSQTVKDYSAAVLGKDDQPWDWRTMGAFLDTLRTTRLGQHVRPLLAHNPLRIAVMGIEQRAATEQEILAQEALVAEAMQAGAAGMSLGLMYVPGNYTPTSELIRLARVVGRYGGVVASHMRGEGDTLLTSLNEMLTIAEQAEVAVHISHLKITGRKNWGHIQQALDLLTSARTRGIDVTVDAYPYAAGSTTITQLLPPWVQEGGVANMLARLSDPAIQQRLRQELAHGLPGWENLVDANGWERMYLAAIADEQHAALEGLNLLEAAEALGCSPEDALFRLILDAQGQITIVLFHMDERDVDQVVQASFSMIGSDGLPILSGRPHPRLYGTFPRFIQRYVRELKSLSLEEAIHKTSAFPAQRFALRDRGSIEVGKIADLVVFDPATIKDQASYSNPQVYPAGIAAVIVSGQPVVMDGEIQPHLPGQVIAPSRPAEHG